MDFSLLTVTGAAEGTDLTTLAAVKADLGLSGTEDDALLADLINRASAMIMSYCGRAFAREALSETFRPSCRLPNLMLARRPVVSDGLAVTEAGETLASADWELDARSGLLYRLDGADGRIDWPAAKIVVTYAAGYILPGTAGADLPADIEQACLSIVKGLWFARDRDPLVKNLTVDGVGSETYWVGGSGDEPIPQGLRSYREELL
jgi:hypothetical protein